MLGLDAVAALASSATTSTKPGDDLTIHRYFTSLGLTVGFSVDTGTKKQAATDNMPGPVIDQQGRILAGCG